MASKAAQDKATGYKVKPAQLIGHSGCVAVLRKTILLSPHKRMAGLPFPWEAVEPENLDNY